MNPPPKTLLTVLDGAAEYLARHEVEDARLNAQYLIGHVLGLKRLELYLQFDRPMSETELVPLRELMKKRGQGVPLQYLLGTAEFHGRTFACDARALIPRPETEQLVELILARVKDHPPRRILDVGTGSGVIAITLAAELPDAEVTAGDISPEALALGSENAKKLGLQDRVSFVVSDLFNSLTGEFDLIVANLPYIPTAELAGLAREVRHDPVLALDGGPDGLQVIARLLTEARPRLSRGGLLALEIHHDQSAAVLASADALGYGQTSAAPDYHGIKRFIFIDNG